MTRNKTQKKIECSLILKNPVFVQVIVLFAGINDIIHGWTIYINTVIFPNACKEHYLLLFTFLVKMHDTRVS